MKKISCSFLFIFFLLPFASKSYAQAGPGEINIRDLNIRDPFLLTDVKANAYLLYKSSSVVNRDGNRVSVVVAYKSKDLELWTGPHVVYTTPENNWAKGAAWAPEVHEYKGKYYLFVTLSSDVEWKKRQEGWPGYVFRGTQIFYADNPLGPFLPFKDSLPQTPMDRMSLDGTLWEEDGNPYMVYCHEWVQVEDGAMELIKLKPDLSRAVGAPVTLFHASAASWSTGNRHANGATSYVTDGCYLYKTRTGKLLMIWSSFKSGSYAIGIAESATNKITGPWRQQQGLLFEKNGGHGMLFRALDGRLLLTLHAPNSPGGKERAHIFEVTDTGNTLVLGKELF